MRAQSVTDVILGEAVSGTRAERYEDMKAVASAMVNRARSLGVPLETVVQNSREFNAYNRSLPPGVNAYRDLADQALNDVLTNGPTHNGTFYATPAAMDNLPNGLQEVTRTTGHVYFSDPQNRAIGTADGYRRPNSLMVQQLANIDENNLPVPSPSPRGLLAESFPATPAPVQRGGLLADISPSSVQRGGMLADITPKEPSFDMWRMGDGTPNISVEDLRRPTFDNARMAENFPTPAIDNSRFGDMQNMSYDKIVAANNANPTIRPDMPQQPTGLLSSAMAGEMPRSPSPQAPSMGLLADQYSQYGMGQAAMQQASLKAMTPPSFQGPVMPGMEPAMANANLGLDVAEQRRKAGLPPAVQPASQPTQQPAVQQPTVQAPMAASPAAATNPGAPAPVAGDFGPSMTPEQAKAMERKFQAYRLGGGVLGGVLGGALLGPVGGLLGGYLGRNMGAKAYYPTAPQAVSGGNNQRISRDTLNDRGRDTYQSSKQFRAAVDKGSAGLY